MYAAAPLAFRACSPTHTVNVSMSGGLDASPAVPPLPPPPPPASFFEGTGSNQTTAGGTLVFQLSTSPTNYFLWAFAWLTFDS